MRTTLVVDDDVLAAAKALAAQRGVPVGKVISELARQTLRGASRSSKKLRNGVPLFPLRAGVKPVTLELVNRLRDEIP